MRFMKTPSTSFIHAAGPGLAFAKALATTGALVLGLAAAALAPSVAGAEDAACLSPNPTVWPAVSKPYFMIGADTSGSMTSAVAGGVPSCGYPGDRLGHLRCSIRNAVQAFSGQVNFGLATYPINMSACSGTCYSDCTYADYPGNVGSSGCGPGTGVNRRGAFIRVPMLQDSFWTTPPADNVSSMVSWVDNSCGSSTELFANGNTPLNGMLRDMKRYFGSSWTAQDSSVTYNTPLASQDNAGAGVNGGTGCRSLNVIFITDGDETCDTQADAVSAAADLYQNGVTVGGKTFKVRTHMINFAGGNAANMDAIAAAGGTGASILVQNESELSIALANILSAAIAPESCDNADNNCNGCTDEGFTHYGNTGQTCCAWANAAARTNCLNQYSVTITPSDPDGDLTKLPCTTPAQAATPTSWLCYNPGESCDNVDNNLVNGVDEGITRCGNPLHCPATEVCDTEDNDCDGQLNEGNVCGACSPQPEVCDGCDNDCDGLTDDGISPVACGLPAPANCSGLSSCSPPAAVTPGGCVPGGPGACNNSPVAESCDSIDNDCDGIVDDGIAPSACEPVGTPPGLVYGGTSQCAMGQQSCGSSSCAGYVGPSAEKCDGIDNNCDGIVDNGAAGVGETCGNSTAPCSAGTTACVGGALTCQGGVSPQPEICDGIDNDCNGSADDPPLVGQPAAGSAGCWNIAGTSCSHGSLTWDAPSGATCNGNGSLTAPCSRGTLACGGASGWQCIGSRTPSAEICDGLDNDCDGTDDDGSALCPVGRSCTDGGCR